MEVKSIEKYKLISGFDVEFSTEFNPFKFEAGAAGENAQRESFTLTAITAK